MKLSSGLYSRLVALFGVLLFALQAEAAEQRYAVIIGNNRGNASERPLRYAERDATTLSSILRRMGDLSAENTVLLLGESSSAIRRALLEVNARIRSSESELTNDTSTLIVYFSGHADEAGLHVGTETLPYRELRAIMRGSAARVRLLVLDACRSGRLTNVKGGRPVPEFNVKTDANLGVEGLVMISSSAAGEDSHESDRLGASFFSHHFSGALLGAGDEDGDGRVTLNEAYAYAYRNTLRASGDTTTLQHPTYAYDLKGRGELTMTRLKKAELQSGTVQLLDPGLYLILDNNKRGDIIAEVRAPRARTRLALPPSQYVVQRRYLDHYREYEIAVEPGETVQLENLDYRKVSYARLVRKGSDLKSAAHAVYMLGGGRAPLIDGQAIGLNALLGYHLHLEHISIGLRLKYGRGLSTQLAPDVRLQHQEIGVAVLAQHFFDLPYLSIGLGLMLEGVQHRQSFETEVLIRARTSYGGAIGALLSFEVPLFGPLIARLEGGPVTYIFKQAVIEAGAETGEALETPLTGIVNFGLGVQF